MLSDLDYNGGIGCQVASVLEETLLLPKDMVELRGLRRNEVFLQAKRCLGMVRIVIFSIFFFLTWHNPNFVLIVRIQVITLVHIYIYIYIYIFFFFFCVFFVVVFFFFFFLNRLFKVRSGWKKFIIPSHSSWMMREREGSLLCRR